MALILLVSIFGICSGHVYIVSRSLPRNEAVTACAMDTFGSIANRELLLDEDLKHIGADLSDGDSAWLGETAVFSDFVFYHGCFPAFLLGSPSHEIGQNNIYRCSKACNSKFIGLQFYKCFCLDSLPQYQMNPGQLVPECSTQCKSLFGETCGDSAAASIYEVVPDEEIGFDSQGPGLDQCVMLSKPNTTYAHTEPCDGPCDTCAYICKVSENSTANLPCQIPGLCLIFGDLEYTWRQAGEHCSQHDGGYLYNASVKTHVDLGNHMIDAFKFWTGYFRTFEINENASSNTGACLAVRKTDNLLRFEATDCSDRKLYICYDPSVSTEPSTKSTTSMASRSTTIKPTFMTTTFGSITKTPRPTTTTSSNPDAQEQQESSGANSFPVWIIIVIVTGIIAMVLIIIFICILAAKRNRRPNLIDYKDNRSTSSTDYVIDHRRGADEADLYSVVSRVRCVEAAAPTLDLGKEYNAEWRRNSRPHTKLVKSEGDTDSINCPNRHRHNIV